MKIENESNASQSKVIESVARLISDLCFDGEFKNHPEYLTEIFEYLLETESGDSRSLRIKMLSCIRTSKMLAKALEPFSDEEVQKAWVLLYPEGMVQLNDSSAEILKLCTGEMTVATIVSTLEAKFNAQGIGPQIRDLLQEGVRRGWIQ